MTIVPTARSPTVDQPQPTAPSTDPAAPSVPAEPAPVQVVNVAQVEAALVEHYPRLVRLAYLVLPPRLGRHRRVMAAHALVQRALPRRPAALDAPLVPAPRGAASRTAQPGYLFVRAQVLRAALEADRGPLRLRGRRLAVPAALLVPAALPQVWGLRLFPRSGGADELAVDQALSALTGAARAACVLRALDRLDDAAARAVLEAAGVRDAQAALAAADTVPVPDGEDGRTLLESPEFDPCSLQARPTDLVRRRQRLRVAGAAGAALAVCGMLLALPDGGWGADGAAAPPYSRNPAAQAALDPAGLTHAATGFWRSAERRDFTSWPARGDRTHDAALLRRALAVWARPGPTAHVSATPGTPTGPAAGPPRLLFAGVVDRAAVVLFADGARVVRYAEAADGDQGGVALDFARVDGAAQSTSSALVVGRADGNVRYLTAPWVRSVRLLDLAKPSGRGGPLAVSADGVTAPAPSPAMDQGPTRSCDSWPALLMDGRVLTDLGDLTPARLTYGDPAHPREATSHAARTIWARTACHLPAVRGHGVRGVNSWPYAAQRLPDGGSWATWVCTRAATWRGEGSRVLAQFQPPVSRDLPYAPGSVAARAEDSPACGPRDPRALAGVLWKSPKDRWYLLAAASSQVASLDVRGVADGRHEGRTLAVPSSPGARAKLTGRLKDGGTLTALH